MATVLEKIAGRLTSNREFSDVAFERAEAAIMDTIGCMIAGTVDDAPKSAAAAFAQEIDAAGPSMVVTGGRSSPSIAALVNGTAAHCLDFDDNFHPARAHASAVLVPALLAIATSRSDISGRKLLEAYLIGLAAQAAIGFGVIPSHYNRGWHGTSTVGCIGTAAGVAVLLDLDEHQTAQAMSLATSMAAGPKGQFGTPAKPFHAGMAARNAVEAALLAKAGLRGRLDILERNHGFLDLFGGEEPRGWDAFSWGEAHVIENPGLVTKLHPCCASTHRAIDAALDLQKEHGFSLHQVLRIETKVGRSAVDNLAYPEPGDEMQARFSMQYCLAGALLQGRLSLADFTPEAVLRPAVRQHMAKISMTAFSPEEERSVERPPHRVRITLADGRTIHTERLHAKGSVAVPISDGEREAKFADCLRWAGIDPGEIERTVRSLKTTPSVRSALSVLDNQVAAKAAERVS